MTQNIFVSYARQDGIAEDNLIDEFLKHGRSRVRNGEIKIFKDTDRIGFGDEWKKKIDDALEITDVAILMVSVNFLNSDFIFEHELKVLLDKHRNDGVKILPVLLGLCDWENERDIEQFQIYPDGNEPLNSMNQGTFEERAVNFFQSVLPSNYRERLPEIKVDMTLQALRTENKIHDNINNSKNLSMFEAAALERWEIYKDDPKNRSYTVEEAAEFNKANYKDVYSFLLSKGYSKPIAFAKTPWFLTAQQFLEIQSEFSYSVKLTKDEMSKLFQKYHPDKFQDYQMIFDTLLAWSDEKLISKNLGNIYWGQNTRSSDLGSVGWIYWKEGRKTSKYRYFLFRIGAQGTVSPSFWWNTQNYSNEDKSPFNSFNFQASVLERFAKIGLPEFGADLTQDTKNLSSIRSENAFTKRDSFVDLAKLSDKKTLNGFLEIFNEIIEEINLTH